MDIKESIEQLESLVKEWDAGDAKLNQTDINAIKKVLEERYYIIKYLKYQINECHKFTKHIENRMKKVSSLGRMAGKTYLANQIMNNAVAERCYEEILFKMRGNE